MNILIKNGTLVSSTKVKKADILLKAGKIEEIASEISENKGEKVINAAGKLILPGGIDPHVHFALPTPAGNSSDDFLSGSKAALMGGTTTIIDFVTPSMDTSTLPGKRSQSLVEALHLRKKEAENCLCDYSFHVSPIDWHENSAAEIKTCVEKEGIQSFKIYMAYAIGLSDYEIAKVMETVSECGGIATVHAENGGVIEHFREKFVREGKTEPKYHPLSRPTGTEAEAINRIIEIAKLTYCPLYVVHVSSRKGIKTIQKAQKKGQIVYAETCPHYLFLDDSVYRQEFAKAAPYVLSPPIRKHNDQKKLWKAIQKTNIQTIGTDHCPFNFKGQKDIGVNDFTKIPNGAGSVEHRMSLLYTYGVLKNRISLPEFVQITSSNAAKIFKLKNKGDLKTGNDADIVIWNTDRENIISAQSHYQNCDTNIYEGFKTKGAPEIVILKGEIKVENGILKNTNKGKFLKR